jgi:hypothetical protein
VKTEQELDQLIAALPRDVQPERDLWQSLDGQLPARESVKKRRLSVLNQILGAAAALTLMLVVGWRALTVPDNAGLAIAGGDSIVEDEPLPAQAIIAQQFEPLKTEQLSQLVPGSKNFGDWQYQLASWDDAIDQVSGALDNYPDDPKLLAQMQRLYAQQIDYLRLVSRVDANNYFSGDAL